MQVEVLVIALIIYGIITLVKSIADYRIPFLKWGLIILFTGGGLILMEMLGFSLRSYQSSLPFGIVLVSVALGFLTYFGIMQVMFKDEEK